MNGSATKITTVRISRDLYNSISTDANNEGIGFDTLLNRILRKYVEWDKPANGIGVLSVPRDMVVEVLFDKSGGAPRYLLRDYKAIKV